MPYADRENLSLTDFNKLFHGRPFIMKIWNTHVHVYVYIFCVTVSKISILHVLLQVALQSQFIIHCYTILIYLIPGLKSLLYI